MAEVRRRLLRRFQMVKDVIPSGRAVLAVLAPSCVTHSVCNRETAAEYKPRKWAMWLSPVHRGHQYMWVPGDMPQIAIPGTRHYSQGPRASFHQTGNHRHGHNNGAWESDAPLYTTRTGYYDILEVSGNATQAQIKTAYYKQSFRYHPDRNAGDASATRLFGQVTEAYHILGSTSLRKKYDRGILSLEDVRTARKPSGKSSSPSRKDAANQRRASSASSTSSITKPMFDFDAFYQGHYGEQLAREKLWKERREMMEKEKRQKRMGSEMTKMVELSAFLLLLPGIYILLSYSG